MASSLLDFHIALLLRISLAYTTYPHTKDMVKKRGAIYAPPSLLFLSLILTFTY